MEKEPIFQAKFEACEMSDIIFLHAMEKSWKISVRIEGETKELEAKIKKFHFSRGQMGRMAVVVEADVLAIGAEDVPYSYLSLYCHPEEGKGELMFWKRHDAETFD